MPDIVWCETLICSPVDNDALKITRIQSNSLFHSHMISKEEIVKN